MNFEFYNHLLGIRFYSYDSLKDRLNMDDNIKYISKNKLNKKNLIKINDYLDNSELHDLNLNNIKLLKSQIESEQFYNDYVLVDSIKNINYNDEFINNFYDNIDKEDIREYNDMELNNYILKFNNILNDLHQNSIYKMIFRWRSVDNDNFGHYRYQFSTSPSFFIYNGININSVLHRFINNLNIIN